MVVVALRVSNDTPHGATATGELEQPVETTLRHSPTFCVSVEPRLNAVVQEDVLDLARLRGLPREGLNEGPVGRDVQGMLDPRDEALGAGLRLIGEPKTDVHISPALVTLVGGQASTVLRREIANGDVVKAPDGCAHLHDGLSQVNDRLVGPPGQVRATTVVARSGAELFAVDQPTRVRASDRLASLLRALVVDHQNLPDFQTLLVPDPWVESLDLLPGHAELLGDRDERIARLDLVMLLYAWSHDDCRHHFEPLAGAYKVASDPVSLRDRLNGRSVAARDLPQGLSRGDGVDHHLGLSLFLSLLGGLGPGALGELELLPDTNHAVFLESVGPHDRLGAASVLLSDLAERVAWGDLMNLGWFGGLRRPALAAALSFLCLGHSGLLARLLG